MVRDCNTLLSAQQNRGKKFIACMMLQIAYTWKKVEIAYSRTSY